MRRSIVVGAFVYLLSLGISQAQVLTPQTSAKSKLEQVVGLTDISVEYSRPSMKGRSVFGDLVPYGRLWRTGANMNTTITFESDVLIEGEKLKQGTYALYTVPKATSWEVYFYSDPNNWGTPEVWNEQDVALKIDVKSVASERLFETFTIAFTNVQLDYADLELAWEKTIVPIRIEVPSDRLAMESIQKTLEGTESGAQAVDYYAASQYYFLKDRDLHKALQWIDQAIKLESENVPYYFPRLKSQILARLGDKEAAVETAKQALEMAEKAQNLDYIKMNKDSIKEWSK